MKRTLFASILLASVMFIPFSTMAQVSINIEIALPPPIVWQAPPQVVVLPDTPDVYVVPYVDADVFFWNGFWWRLWGSRWYRSLYYNRGWAYYEGVPNFYFDVDPGWRTYYRERTWRGYPWYYERIPQRQLQRNWRGWYNSGHWERKRTWGVQGYQPRPPQQREDVRRERQQQYHQQHQPPGPPHGGVQPPPRNGQIPHGPPPGHFPPQGRPEGGERDYRR